MDWISNRILNEIQRYKYRSGLCFLVKPDVPVEPEEPDIPDTPTGIYDDEFPIEWNSADVMNNYSVNMGGLGAAYKVSNVVLTEEEATTATITWNGVAYPYHLHFGYEGTSAVTLYSYGDNDDVCFLVAQEAVEVEGIAFEAGMYCLFCDGEYSVSLPVYDDTFPIEWSMADVQNNATLELGATYYKISNLTPTESEFSTITCTFFVDGEYRATSNCEINADSGIVMATFACPETDNTNNVILLWVINEEFVENMRQEGATEEEISAFETGTYCIFLNLSDYPDESFSFKLSQSASTYLYGHEAPSVVSYNGVELPDIESVWDKSVYPYAFISAYDGSAIGIDGYYYRLIISDEPIERHGSNGDFKTGDSKWCGYGSSKEVAEFVVAYIGWECGHSGEWSALKTLNESGGMCTGGGFVPVWSNHDIMDYANDTLHYAASSDPVHSYPEADVIIDGVGYKGAVLPSIDEVYTDELKAEYPYVAVSCVEVNEVVDGAKLYAIEMMDKPVVVGSTYVASTKMYWCTDNQELVDEYEGFGFSIGFNEWEYYMDIPEEEMTIAMENIPIIWSNHDIADESGTVYLPTTNPIPITSEPIGYSYNGTVLPELPEWDKEQYPYACVSAISTAEFGADGHVVHLYAADKAFRILEDDKPDIPAIKSPFKTCEYYLCTTEEAAQIYAQVFDREIEVGVWGEMSERNITSGDATWYNDPFTWANHDILKNDDTVRFSATNPIPVYGG